MSRFCHRLVPEAGQDGMTMIEILVVVIILIIIAFPIASILVIGLIIPSQEQQRIADTGDAQLLQSFLINDVQSATTATTSVALGSCSQTSAVLELTGTDQTSTSSSIPTTVDYVAANSQLVRYYCESGSPSSQVTVLNSLTTATASCATYTCSVTLTEPGNAQGAQPYVFTLSATRRPS